jgi:hypothetical protein
MTKVPFTYLEHPLSIYHLKIHVVTPKLCFPSDALYIVCLLISHVWWAFPVWKLWHSLWEAQTADVYPPPSAWFALDLAWVVGHGCDSGATVQLELNHCGIHHTNLLLLLLHPNHLHYLLTTQMRMVLGYLQQRTLILQPSAVLFMWHNIPIYNAHLPVVYTLVPTKSPYRRTVFLQIKLFSFIRTIFFHVVIFSQHWWRRIYN